MGSPIDPIFRTPSNGLVCVTGVVSVMPKPSTITAPVAFSKSWMTSTGSGALPEKNPLKQVRSIFLNSGWLSMPMYMVGTSAPKFGLNFLMASKSGSG